jgi:hypothetical protein
LDTASNGGEFQRADCAPRATLGNGGITLTDWVQAGRYVSGLDPVTVAGGPSSPGANAASDPLDDSNNEPESNPPINLFGASLKGLVGPRDARAVYAVARSDNSVLVGCSALGDENAFGFSVNFDPAQWRFVSVASGADARDAAIFVNTRRSANGRIGVAMALPPNRKLPAGARQVAVLTFRPRSGNIAPSSPAIEFTDSPVAREVVDVNAKRLRASFVFDAGHRAIALRKPGN